jgi:hypothetical protein
MSTTPTLESFGVLAQLKPLSGILTDFFLVDDSAQTVCSSLMISNSSGFQDFYYVSIAIAGVANSPEQYIYQRVPVNPYDTFGATVGLTLDASDVMRVSSVFGNLSFTLYGVNIIEVF